MPYIQVKRPIKINKLINAFYFILKAIFVLKIFKIFIWLA